MRPIPRFLSTVAALAAINATTASCARSDETHNKVQAAAPASSGIDNPRAQHSNAAVKILAGVEQARDAIRHGNRSGAETHIDSALAMLQGIDSMPLVPIYTELSQTSVIGPLKAAKGETEQANSIDAVANSTANASTNESTNSAGVAVKNVTTGYSRVLLDTSVAKRQLAAAKAALAKGDGQAADKALIGIEQAVVLESSAARLPLVRARENLALASAAAVRSNWQASKAQLTAAAKAIGDYQKFAPAGQVADLKLLQQQIGSYAGTIDQQHGDAVPKIDGWWSTVADFTDQEG